MSQMYDNSAFDDRPERDPDRFIHMRGPHEGRCSDGEHVCVPECSEDTSHLMEGDWWVDPRPQYRVLVEPWYDHDHGEGGHDDGCATGYGIEISMRNLDVRGELGQWRQVGVTQTESGATLDVREVHALVVDLVVELASPHAVNVSHDRIKIYALVN